MFSQTDILLIQQKGINVDVVKQQVDYFKNGIPFLNISKPATANDGILVPDEKAIDRLISVFESQKRDKKIIKFVPASGAATRMFKALYEFISKPVSAIIPDDVAQVINKLELFAFYHELREIFAKKGQNLAVLIENSSYQELIDYILTDKGLNYGNLPKGLLKFHAYPEVSRTAMEEHLVEGALYAKNADHSVTIHFTVSPEHLDAFNKLANQVKEMYENNFGVKFHISFSVQKSSTDTIAVDEKNNPFRDNNGMLTFRPGGHGALLDNLNDLDGDIIFLKNIDNVVPDRLKQQTVRYKRVLAGLLLQLQEKVFEYLFKLEKNVSLDNLFYNEVSTFIQIHLGYRFPSGFSSLDTASRAQWLVKILNRPIRVCGMVKNTGEPGGGPFWIVNQDGAQSLQILESSQFNLNEENHQQVYKKATHFNPVDIVMATHDYKGQKFNLTQYRDPDTGFISLKSKDGREIKALELPGLWNGAMANWNTAFVEVPLITFNPVKSINDLLRPEHMVWI
jgi:hypothetical protein